jgi:hypothetical protein
MSTCKVRDIIDGTETSSHDDGAKARLNVNMEWGYLLARRIHDGSGVGPCRHIEKRLLTKTPPKRRAGKSPAATPYPLPGICEHQHHKDRRMVLSPLGLN